MRFLATKRLCFSILLFLAASGYTGHQAALAELCGMQGSDGAIPTTEYAGWWRTTWGTMRLVEFSNHSIEGPSTASGYLKGQQIGTTLQGRFSEDTGSYYAGNVTITMSQQGRCIKGELRYDDGDHDEFIGYRIHRPMTPYQQYVYALTDRTEHLKHMIGGMLNFADLDGSDHIDLSRADTRAENPSPTLEESAEMPTASAEETDE